MLGSPHASDRWRAAHSVRCFARFERWNVIDALIARFATKVAHPFQAPELPFYYMHARLWLLIALARIALDNPKRIAKYHKVFTEIVLDRKLPHVLMRHFASRAILACIDSGKLKLSCKIEKQIRAIDLSPFPRLKEKLKQGEPDSFYQGRPVGTPKPSSRFSLDYDFANCDVTGLSDVFGKQFWEVEDLISEAVRNFDTDITSMHDKGGREVSQGSVTSGDHSYGQQLGWHSLLLAAGKLLQQYPVTDDYYYDDDPWAGWLNLQILTRHDGLWLSDGMDRPPLEAKNNLFEKDNGELVITGSKTKILKLIGIDSDLENEIVVEGSWSTPDGIKVRISSALVAPRKVNALAKQMIQEDPFFVCLPTYDQYENQDPHLKSYQKNCVPWIVCPYLEGRLDEGDPLASICTMHRPHFAENIVKTFSLRTNDPFKRIWKNPSGITMAYSEAWGKESKFRGEASCSGVRLRCLRKLLRTVLTKQNSDLVILVKLQRYEEGFGNRNSWFSNTIAVIRMKRNLNFEFYKGAVNKIKETKH
jgi:hypothetical protein